MMNKNRCIYLIAMITLLAFTVVIALLGNKSVEASSAVLYVAPNGNCGGANPCYSNIQEAVDAAQSGDSIRIARGVYAGVQNIDHLNTTYFTATQVVAITKNITVQGGYTISNWETPDPQANPTTLDAQNQGRVACILNAQAALVGLRFVNGNADGLGGRYFSWGQTVLDVGGGIYTTGSTITINDSDISNNRAPSFAGGMYTDNVRVVFVNNRVANNVGTCTAGVYLEAADHSWVKDNTFDSNPATGGNCYTGGGLYVQGDNILVEGNIFTRNRGYGGGGLGVKGDVTVKGNTFRNNWSIYGGGLHISGGRPLIIGNMIANNTVYQAGGGVSIFNCGPICEPSLVNNVIVDNTMDGSSTWFLSGGSAVLIYYGATVELSHNTIARNRCPNGDGSAIFIHTRSSAYLTNNILVSHTVGISATKGTTVTVNSILFYDTPVTIWQDPMASVEIQNQRIGDPAFATDGYHLMNTSAAINAGVNAGVAMDIDGDVRPQGGGFDLGADELVITLISNYASGSPGSYFTLTGQNFPPNSNVSVSINGHILPAAVTTTGSGDFVFLLDTSQADPGYYAVTVVVNPSATVGFMLDSSVPLRPQEGSGPIISVPNGIALNRFIYLPLVIRANPYP